MDELAQITARFATAIRLFSDNISSKVKTTTPQQIDTDPVDESDLLQVCVGSAFRTAHGERYVMSSNWLNDSEFTLNSAAGRLVDSLSIRLPSLFFSAADHKAILGDARGCTGQREGEKRR